MVIFGPGWQIHVLCVGVVLVSPSHFHLISLHLDELTLHLQSVPIKLATAHRHHPISQKGPLRAV